MKAKLKQYGVTGAIVYGAIAVAELPILYGIVKYKGVDWMVNAERRLRTAVGAPAGDDDLLLHGKGSGGELAAQLGAVFLLHKALIVVRLPLAAAITPRIARRSAHSLAGPNAGRAAAGRTGSPAPGRQASTASTARDDLRQAKSVGNPKALENMGKPPSARSKWLSWFF